MKFVHQYVMINIHVPFRLVGKNNKIILLCKLSVIYIYNKIRCSIRLRCNRHTLIATDTFLA